MRLQDLVSSLRSPRNMLLGLLVFFCLVTLASCGGNGSAEIYDNAQVLNSSKVQRAAADLSSPLAIYTTRTFQGTRAEFQRTALARLNGDPNKIVMAIDTTHRYVYIARGSHVSISASEVDQAVKAFASSYHNGNYTTASTAAIRSLNRSTRVNSATSSGVFSTSTLFCCLIPLLLVLLVALFGASRRRRRGMMQQPGFFSNFPFRLRRGAFPARRPYEPQQPYEQNPYQGYYPPQNQGLYQGGASSGPSPRQGGGMNPWAAGGLGAAAGGLAGYFLGKREGERDAEGSAGGRYGHEDFGRGDDFSGGQGGGASFGGGDFGNDAFAQQGGGFGNDDGGDFGRGNFDADDSGAGGSF